jgi:hypothetical protein
MEIKKDNTNDCCERLQFGLEERLEGGGGQSEEGLS